MDSAPEPKPLPVSEGQCLPAIHGRPATRSCLLDADVAALSTRNGGLFFSVRGMIYIPGKPKELNVLFSKIY